MAGLMQIEFLVIHSFPFITIVALLRPSTPRGRVLQRIAFFGLLGLYLLGASTAGGWRGVLIFAALTLATYAGFLLYWTRGAQILRLGFRWLVSFILFLILAGITRMPESVNEWNQASEVCRFGFFYFLALGLLEGVGVYQARWIDQIPVDFRRQPPG